MARKKLIKRKWFVIPVVIVAILAGIGMWGYRFLNPEWASKAIDIPQNAPVKTIAVAEIQQEVNSFSPVPTAKENFQAGVLLYGQEIIPNSLKEDLELGGFVQAVRDIAGDKVRLVPILQARSSSGGPIKRKFYDHLKKRLIAGIQKIDDLDGIYLSLHGSMGVEGLRDPEGDLLQAIRREIGTDIPIGVSHDLHANITERRVELADFIVGYKTNPHRDHYEVGYRSGEILVGTVYGQYEPVMVHNKMKLLKGGGMNIDFLAPMRSVFDAMHTMEKNDKILAVSNFMVHLWQDDPELGWSTVAVADGARVLAQKQADKIADMNWARRDAEHAEPKTPEQAIAIVRDSWAAGRLGPAVFCDVSDTVGAGAPGGNTWILRALVNQASDLTSYVPVRDSVAARKAYGTKVGAEISLTLGGRLDKTYNEALDFTGKVVYKDESYLGKTAIVCQGGVHVILAELPDSYTSPEDYSDLGLSVWGADIIVVKNLFPFRYNFLLYNRKTVNVQTPGTTNVDVFSLEYDKIRRPIYPLDKIDDWR